MEPTFKSQKAEEQDEGLQLKLGQSIDRYEVEAWIGQGGCANVYKVRHKQLGITRALKLLQPSSPALQKRFINEGRLQAQWQHPNIVRVHDALLVENQPALILDFIDGLPLHHHIQKHRPDFQQLTDLFIGIVKGVSHAHRNGIIHRDLKPSNILIEQQNGQFVARVTDFGIAKHLNPTPTDQPKTRTDAMMGTPHYMAPEQIRHNHPITAQTDIFCLGTILFEMCCGVRPFEQPDSLQLLNAIANVEHPHPSSIQPGVPPILVHIIEGCLQVEPHQRFDSCESILLSLRHVPDTQPESPISPPQPPQPKQAQKTKRWPAMIGVGGLMILGALGLNLSKDAPPAHQKTPSTLPDTPLNMELRALRLMNKAPAKALALLRASATLAPSAKHSIHNPHIRFDLLKQGAKSHVVPLDEEGQNITINHKGDQIAVVGGGRLWFINTSDGTTIKGEMPKHFTDTHPQYTQNDKLLTLQHKQTRNEGKYAPRLLKTDDGSLLATLNHDTLRNVIDVDGKVIGLSFNGLAYWDMDGRLLNIRKLKHRSNSSCIRPYDKNSFLLTSTQKVNTTPSQLQRIDVKTLQPIHTVTLDHAMHFHPCKMIPVPEEDAVYFASYNTLGKYKISTGETLAQRHHINDVKLIVHHSKRDRILLVGSEWLPYQILDDQTLKTQHTLGGHDASIRQAHINPLHNVITTASSDRTVGVFTLGHQLPKLKLKGHQDWVLDMSLPQQTNPSLFWTSGRDHTARRWSLDFLPRPIKHAKLPNNILYSTWSKDGQHLAFITKTGEGYLWHKAQPEKLHLIYTTKARLYPPQISDTHVIFVQNEPSPAYNLKTHKLDFMPIANRDIRTFQVKDTFLAYEASTYKIVIQSLGTQHKLVKLDRPCTRFRFYHLPSSDEALVACRNGTIQLINLQTKQMSATELKIKALSTLAYHPKTQKVLIGTWWGQTTVWNQRDHTHQPGHTTKDGQSLIINAHEKPWFVTASPNGEVHLIDAHNGKHIKHIDTLDAQPRQILFTKDDQWLIVLTTGGLVHFFETQTFKQRHQRHFITPVTTIRQDGNQLLGFDKQHLWSIDIPKHTTQNTLNATGQWTNYRVCKSTGRVVPVVPFPPADTIWAPEPACNADR